jgi:tetratricopeptide (TPR) repeat protein
MYSIKRIILIILLLINKQSFGVNKKYVEYYNYCSEARYNYHIGNYKKSISLLNSAFSMPDIDTNCIDKYCMALCYAKIHNYTQSASWLIKCLNKTSSIGFLNFKKINDSTFLITDTNFNFITIDQNLNRKISLELKLFVERVNADKKLIRMVDSANYFHVNDMFYHSKENRNTLLKRKKSMKYIDSSFSSYEDFQKRVVEFVLRNNEIIGVSNYSTEVFLTPILHLTSTDKKRILPILKTQFENGKLSPLVYGFFMEKIIMSDIEEPVQRCSGYYIINTSCSNSYWETYKKNRKSIGLSIYLDFDDYAANTFVIGRALLPWIKNKTK